ncbi:hypothetical protein D3C76_1460420 [compost metagenome]
MVNARQAAAHHGLGKGPGLLVDEQRRAERQRTAGEKAAAEADAAKATHAHHVAQRTLSRAVGHRLGADQLARIGLRQQYFTMLRGQAPELKLGQGPGRIVKR